MRGGLERWKRGSGSQGVRQAIAYALQGSCDAHCQSAGGDALGEYSGVGPGAVARFSVQAGTIIRDELDAARLTRWVDGRDPETGELRGRALSSPAADLVLDCTINAPKSFSIATLLHPGLEQAYEALQDRLRDRILRTWEAELNARRGAGGRVREAVARLEVVELQHRRSRALDPHIHRHLWLNVRVCGQDGCWSNVDSRVAMRVQTLNNAEGELAARTDPEWVAALAAHGYTLGADGEITELAHLVRAVSRRSTQIEANRALLRDQWMTAHPGQTPGPDVEHAIDRHAWALGRPGTPHDIDEGEWAALIRRELTDLDPALLAPRAPVRVARADVDRVDRDLLARCAVADADARSHSSNGRFSVLDVRAGAGRAVAASGITGERARLQPLIDDVTARALAHTQDLVPDEAARPEHVKALVTRTFASLKTDLGQHLAQLTAQDPPSSPDVRPAFGTSAAGEAMLDASQRAAATAVAGGCRVVTVTGPAGTGKTTMLRAARAGLEAQGRRLLIVAPTRKAAAVAAREVGTTGTSIHALLADCGWRWGTDDAGAAYWWRLQPGQRDPATGRIYRLPVRRVLGPGVRVVVDEAGMLDLYAADALVRVAWETGAGIALVGDPQQASPVGHAGAMALATRRAGQAVELTGVHRFADPDYAALTLRLRTPHSLQHALETAGQLQEQDHLHRVGDETEARTLLVDGYFHRRDRGQSVAIVTATNEEARLLNEMIQNGRIARRQQSTHRVAIGAGEQHILEGDTVQTRRNDHTAGVENRAIWTVTRIARHAITLQRGDDTTDTRTITREYAAEHLHLAYATTVHGIQGETTDTSLVGPGVDAAGLYVGLTRGRHHNEAIVIAPSDTVARTELARTMMRGLPEPDLDDATRAARTDLNRSAHMGSIADNPRGHTGTEDSRTITREQWLTTARSTLRALDSTAATNEAHAHGRDPEQANAPRDGTAFETRRRLEAHMREVAHAEAGDLERYLDNTGQSHCDNATAHPVPGEQELADSRSIA